MSKPSRIIFLDVDGVLNTGRGLDGEKIRLLANLVKRIEGAVVISSTWRLHYRAFDHLVQVLAEHEIPVRGITPDHARQHGLLYEVCRGEEIQEWLTKNRFEGKFCILDDSSDMGHLKKFLFQTNSVVGLTEKICNDIEEFFRKDA